MVHYVYKITDPITNEYYIGVRSCDGKPKDDPYMGSYCSWTPEDESRLVKEILKSDFTTRKEANEYERTLQIIALKENKDPKCMNVRIFGIGYCNYGKPHSEEHKRKIGKSRKGRKHTEEAKRKIRKKRKLQKFTEETKQKISEAVKGKNHPMYGKTHSEEAREKMSESHKGKPSWNKGKKFSKEHKRKMSESHKGKTLSEETKEKISEAVKGKNHPSYGTMWIYSETLKESKKIQKDESIPDGWIRGRNKKEKI